MQKHWTLKNQPPENQIKTLSKALNTTPLNAKLLLQRGINNFDEAKAFFRPKLDQLHSPFLMADMQKAVKRINIAFEEGQKIMVYGDYDVDGTTSVAMVSGFLKKHYQEIETYIPNRYSEGYGISFRGIDKAEELGCDLIIALDCGIKALDKVQYAAEKNINFIICDHHTPGNELPAAEAVLDPKRVDCQYPYKELSGCGIGFKLMQALCEHHQWDINQLYFELDLVAISISCDIVPITGENRILAFYGLQLLNSENYHRKGVKRLLEIANKQGRVDVSTLVFVVGPRINAAGRIQDGKNAVELLTANDVVKVEEYSYIINEQNKERKDLDSDISKEALAEIERSEKLKHAKSTVLYNEDWHKGVIGIVASRLIEQYHRPTIMLTESNGTATGSARSVSGFDIYQAIEACSEHVIQFGGHKYAAGLTIEIDKIEDFKEAFEKYVSENITEDQLTPEILIDAEVNLDEITESFFKVMQQMAPFGPENMTPVLVAKNLVDAGFTKCVGADESHLKVHLSSIENPNFTMSGIAFRMGEWLAPIKAGKQIDIAFSVEENVWNGNRSLQLMVRDIKLSEV